ncbi:MAG: hypothetical protein KGZ96_09275 [Clostridia bacterium]|nr:hypothetical protein [Clostridia bacterium]
MLVKVILETSSGLLLNCKAYMVVIAAEGVAARALLFGAGASILTGNTP